MLSRFNAARKMALFQAQKRYVNGPAMYPSFAQIDGAMKKWTEENSKRADAYLDETEVITRMNFVLNAFAEFDLEKIDWASNFESQGIDSLEQVAILTSIEHEFHTIFEDNLFDQFETLEAVKKHLSRDHSAF